MAIVKQGCGDFSRRQILRLGLAAMTTLCAAPVSVAATVTEQKNDVLRLALLHLNPRLGDLEYNCQQLERAMRQAAKAGASWLVTPELCLTGYRFDRLIGTDWIKPGPDQWLKRLQQLAAELNVVLFLSHLEQAQDGNRYNTLFVIDRSGDIIGRHKKINTIPVSESWSQPGSELNTVEVDGHRVGLLICADAWPAEHAQTLKQKGAELIISSANWPPGQYGPANTWEQRSLETGLPVFVANRTGVERQFDMTQSHSVVAYQGKRVFQYVSPTPVLILVDWNMPQGKLLSQQIKLG